MILNLVILFSIVFQRLSDLLSSNSFYDQLSLYLRRNDLEFINVDKMVMMKKNNNSEVFVTVATYGYREFTVDFYQSSHLHEYNNFFVVVHDNVSYQFFHSHRIPVALYHHSGYDKPLAFINQGSKEFSFVASFKFTVVRYLLTLNVTVLYSDSDIILFQNPFQYLHSIKTDSIIFQQDRTICTGFFFIKPTSLSISLLDRSLIFINKTKNDDQEGMIQAYKAFNLTPVLLPNTRFMNGGIFFRFHQYSWDEVSPSIIMMHNNYIRGHECKRLRMLEMGLEGRKHDSESNLYLTAESMPFDKKAIRSQLQLLVSLSNQLNRILIIPPIKCSKGKGFCTICNQEGPNCYWDILQQLKNGYRESSFMMKDEAPQSLKRAETTEPFHFFNSTCMQQYPHRVIRFPARTNEFNPIVCNECHESYSQCVLKRFLNSKQTLVSLYVVYRCLLLSTSIALLNLEENCVVMPTV